MKTWQVTAGVAGVTTGIVGLGLALTNPGPELYNEYAVEELITYVRENVCQDLPAQLRQFSEQCRSLSGTFLDTARPQLQSILEANTQRENYLLFSIYRTRLGFPPVVPNYEFETVGILNQFFVYQMEEP